MHSFTAFEIVRLFIIVAGATVLVLGTIFLRPWVFTAWVKPAFWLLGLACIAWAALRLVLVFHGHAMSRQMYHFFDSQQPFMLGVASATLILFFISGEVSRGMARWRELKKSSAGLRGVGDSSGDEN